MLRCRYYSIIVAAPPRQEQRDKLGGRAYQYEVNGFRFDGGPTVITAPYMFDELYAEAAEAAANHDDALLADGHAAAKTPVGPRPFQGAPGRRPAVRRLRPRWTRWWRRRAPR